MATKPRHRKTEIQLWVVDNRKRLNQEPIDLAKLTGVTEATARGWESRGRPSDEAIAILERHFGRPAPTDDQDQDDSALAAAIRGQTEAINGLVSKLDVLAEAVAELLADRVREASSRSASGAGSR